MRPADPPEDERQPIHFVDAPESAEIEARVERRPMVPLIVLMALIISGVAVLRSGGDDATPPPTTTPTTAPATSSTPGVDVPEPESDVRPDPIAFDPVDAPLVGLAASRPPNVRFWRIGLQEGVATPLAGPDVDESIRSVRMFGHERAVALLDESRMLVLKVDGDRVLVDQVADVGARTFLGLDFVADDGRSAWVRTSVVNSLLRWDLATGATLGRWVDLDGDLEDPPVPVGIVNGDDLVVRAGVETFVIDDASITRISVVGTPEAAAGTWVLSSSCTPELRCGQLHLLEIVGDEVRELDDLARYTSVCGTMAAGPSGDVAIVTRRLAVANLLRFHDGEPPLEPVSLHIANWGCVDLHGFEIDGETTWVSSSLRGVSVTESDRRVELVGLEAIGGLDATGWGPADQRTPASP